MEVKQIYNLINESVKEVLGQEALVKEDLSNLVDVGAAVFDANSFDHFTGKLVDKVGRMVFVNRKYEGSLLNTLMKDGWEYGAVLQKVSSKMPNATENESWELTDGASYDPNVFHKPDVTCKFYNKYVTFEVDRSITEKQLKSAFNSVGEMNGFLSMIFNEIDKAFTVALSNLAHRTINNAIAETMYTEYNSGTSFSGATHTRAVNLLYLYNNTVNAGGTALTVAKALSDVNFLKFASMQMGLYIDRLKEISSLFNLGEQERFTPEDRLSVVMLSEFKKATDSYLQSTTFHNALTALPGAETIAYWQGSGTDYAFSSTGKIYAKTTGNHDVTATGVLAVMFDKDALGINNMDRWVRTQVNGKGDFTNYFYKMTAQYFTDFNENLVVFFIA